MDLPQIGVIGEEGLNSQIRNAFSIPCNVRRYDLSSRVSMPSMVFVQDNLDLALKVRGISDAKVVLVYGQNSNGSLLRAYEKGMIDGSVKMSRRHIEESELRDVAKRLGRSLHATYNIAFIGYRTLAHGVMQRIAEERKGSHIGNIGVYSGHHSEKYYDDLVTLGYDMRTLPEFHDSIEGALRKCDIAIVSRGNPDVDYNEHQKNGRGGYSEQRESFDGVVGKILPVINAGFKVGFKGAWMLETNPGSLLDLFSYVGFPKDSIFQVQNDSSRMRNCLASEIRELARDMAGAIYGVKIKPSPSDIENVVMVGPHESPDCLFDKVALAGHLLSNVVLDFRNDGLRSEIMKNYRKSPQRIVKSSLASGCPYSGTPASIADAIKRAAYFDKFPDSLTLFVERYGTFIDFPGELYHKMEGGNYFLRARAYDVSIPKEIDKELRGLKEMRRKVILDSDKVPDGIKKKVMKRRMARVLV